MSTRLEDYRLAFGGRLSLGKRPALLLVDIVMAYLTPGSALYAKSFADTIPLNVQLVEAARVAGMPIAFTRVLYRSGGLDGGLFYRKIPALAAFDNGSALSAFPERLTPQPQEILVTKQYASAFFGTSLASTLFAMGVDSLLITGFSTSGCVRATAVDALQHGLAPFVIDGGCADRHPDTHAANLFDLQAKYAEVIDGTQALALIGGAE